MLSYSIAIRTLGTAGTKYLDELRSITRQTIQPEKVVVYIADGYKRPTEQIGREEYVWVKKGMMAQRALPYNEITSDCILMLDDDVLLAPDSVENLLRAMEENAADCVGADSFRNQDLTLASKVYAAVSNLVFPRRDDGWAFKIHRNGSFSYNNHPQPKFYLSQSCAGPCALWRKDAFLRTHLEIELWCEHEGFWYGEDVLLFFKLYSNGGRLGILYNSGVSHLDGQTASGAHREDLKKYYTRSKASAIIWHRTIWQGRHDLMSASAFAFKQIWLLFVNCTAGVIFLKPQIPVLFLRGLWDAYRFSKSNTYRLLPAFISSTTQR